MKENRNENGVILKYIGNFFVYSKRNISYEQNTNSSKIPFTPKMTDFVKTIS